MYRNWIEVFRETVSANKNKEAVVHGESTINFEKLNEKSMQVAWQIKSRTTLRNRAIVVLLPKSIEVVYADIGIMYSCNIFSNLDVKTPRERLNNILKALNPIGIITNDKGMTLVDILPTMFTINIDHIEANNYSEECIMEGLNDQIDTDPFCIINTSGSTGTPKGVVLNHKSFFDFTEWAFSTFSLNKHDRYNGSVVKTKI